MENRKRIAVLFGGCSPEYAVSLQSAYAVLEHMDQTKFLPIPIGITREGDWYYYTGDFVRIADDTWFDLHCCIPAAVSPGRSDPCLLVFAEAGVLRLPIDGAFPVLHGQNGEDGTVQGVFALAGIPVVGCGVLASALCMDKDRAHRLVEAAGIAVPRSFVIDRHTPLPAALGLGRNLGYPLFVKPVGAGSSFGISKVTAPDALEAAISLALEYDSRVILEEYITGFEVGCAVMGNDALTVGAVDEIELSEGFFDYTEKYTLQTSAIHLPARIAPDMADSVKRTAKTIYRTLGCRGFARVDMFLTPAGRILFNEVNTIPGCTAHSRFPNMLKAVGISFADMLTTVIELAVEP